MTDSKLAIDGADPEFAPDSFPTNRNAAAVRESVMAAVEDGTWADYEGVSTERLRGRIADYFGVKLVQLCSSGTIAVELALRGAGVRPGDEVVLAGYDFPGNFRAIEATGAKPVLVDVVEHGWTIDLDNVHAAITELTAAVVVSHLHGQIVDLPRWVESIKSANPRVVLIEDACQVPGGQLDSQPLGGLADVATLSFGGSKLLSAGRGGALMTNREDILQRAKIFANRGNDAFPLSQLQAAALQPQFSTLSQLTQQRADAASWLRDQLRSIPGIIVPEAQPNSLPAYYKFPLLLDPDNAVWPRDQLVAALNAEWIPAGQGFRGFVNRPPRRCRKTGPLVNAQVAAEQTVLLHHSILQASSGKLERLVATIEKICNQPPGNRVDRK